MVTLPLPAVVTVLVLHAVKTIIKDVHPGVAEAPVLDVEDVDDFDADDGRLLEVADVASEPAGGGEVLLQRW
jgi:hypothetical protein